ncbi:prolipoprotein diacylglyceryl transferase [Spiroplasma endosymbiont of Dactylopius coccus]|nr:prolipoprotein diacylglyceryl transferase [Spiroplasma ixodetis]
MLNLDFFGPHGITDTYGGWFHVYAFAIMSGIFASIIASWVKFKRYRVPTDSLAWSIIFIIPTSLFGASFLGKDDPDKSISFFEKFAFWKPGLSIHGGVLFGIIAGAIIFYFVGRKYKISLWIYGDLIIPNILLGQILGRWGNFFNHELLGNVVSYDSLSWLPAFIRDNCFKLIGGPSGNPEMINGEIVYRAPIFLYESIANLGLWLAITFIVPNLGKWFGKKPWKVEPDKFQFHFKDNFKYWGKITFNPKYWNKVNRDPKHLTWTKMWNEVYYYNQVPKNVVNKALAEVKPSGKKINDYINKSKKLYEINNPHHYRMMHAGVQMGLYFFGWNLIRFILELQRPPEDLFLINRPILDYTILLLITFFGLFLAIFAQFVAAKYLRSEGWTYEKEYY